MTTLFADNFTRANSTGLGSNWAASPDAVSTGFDIVSDAAITHNTANDSGNVVTAVTWPNDQWAQVTLGVVNADGGFQGNGPCVRRSASAYTYYRLIVNANNWEVNRVVAGAYTQIGTGTSGAATGDVWYLGVQGTTLTVKQNGSTVSSGTITDSGISSGDAGIGYSSTDTTATLTGFAGGNFLTGGSSMSMMGVGT